MALRPLQGSLRGRASRQCPEEHKRNRIMNKLIAQFVFDEQGQDLIEYALLAGFISLAVVTVVTNVGKSLNTLYSNVNTQVDSAGKAAS